MLRLTLAALLLMPSLSLAGDLSEHFSLEEFNQKTDPLPPCDVKVDMELVERLEALRKLCMNRPIIITSGYRSIEHNRNVGGVDHSQHLLGKAADIKVDGVSMERLATYARFVGFSFVKVYKTHVHVDVR